MKQPLDYVNRDYHNQQRRSSAERCGWQKLDLIKVCLILTAIAIGLVCLAACHPVYAQGYEDYYLAQGFTLEQIDEMERLARQQWREDVGDKPKPLSAEQLEYLKKQTALLQEAHLGTPKAKTLTRPLFSPNKDYCEVCETLF